MDINKLSKDWAYSRLKSIPSLLSKKKINKTGRLSKSMKVKISGTDNPSIDFSWIFYGKFVRAHYLKQGFDILAPMLSVSELTKKIALDLKKQVIEDIKKTLK